MDQENLDQIATKEFFDREYLGTDKTFSRLAQELGCQPYMLARRAKKLGIATKPDPRTATGIDYVDRDYLYNEYIIKEKSTLEIAKDVGVSPAWINTRLKRFDIPLRKKKELNITKERLYDLYIIQNKQSSEIATILGCCQASVVNLLHKYKIDIKPLTYTKARKDLTGRKFGYLTAIRDVGINEHRSRLWECQCTCGNTTIKSSDYLLNKKYKEISCGHADGSLLGFGCIGGGEWNKILSSIKDRGIEMRLHLEDAYFLYEAQYGKCNLTGEPIHFGENRTASLDRIDSGGIYEMSNCQWVHTNVNFMKGALNQDRFIYLCRQVCDWQRLSDYGLRERNEIAEINLSPPTTMHYGWKGCGLLSGSVWYVTKKSHHGCYVSIEYAWDLFVKQKGKCAITGIPLYLPISQKDSRLRSASLDRIDSSRGYHEDNIQWVYRDINMMKQDLPQTRFIELCYKVAKHADAKEQEETIA